MVGTTSRAWLCGAAALLGAVLLASCFESRETYGGETHFMRGCADVACGDGLSCVCGVCTRACEDGAACEDLGAAAACAAVAFSREACGESIRAIPARACVATCEGDADCRALGAGFACEAGQCRERSSASAPPVFVSTDDRCAGDGCAVAAQALEPPPLVMLLVDSSGSMERKVGCACTTPGCEECLPDCSQGERNRWTGLLEALTGTYQDFACERLERTEDNGATFDVGYYLPHIAPSGAQADDGVIDVYGDRVRFGVATFDGYDTYAGAPPQVPFSEFDFELSASWAGLWSYNPVTVLGEMAVTVENRVVGSVHYPGMESPHYIDTGVRGPDAEQGALIGAVEPERAQEVNAQVKAQLQATRPYGGTPIAASLDDLYWYLGSDPQMAVERTRPVEKHVVLITDGYPDSDYRDVRCDCATAGDPSDTSRCGGDPMEPRFDPFRMHCPYPVAADGARQLRCGRGESCDGPATQVHVVGYDTTDAIVVDALDAIAIAGGSTGARFVRTPSELRAVLANVIEQIAP